MTAALVARPGIRPCPPAAVLLALLAVLLPAWRVLAQPAAPPQAAAAPPSPARAAAAGESPDASPLAYCARVGTDDSTRPLPHELVPAAERAFGVQLPPPVPERGVIWRCDEGRTLGCFVGANLPCGRLDTRTELPAVSQWCEDHPGAGVPMSVSGHDTAWRWHCSGAQADRVGAAWQLDGRGFVAGLWRPLDPPG